jgi:PDZ domain-containing protein
MAGTDSRARRACLVAIGVALVVIGAALTLGRNSDTFVLLPDTPHAAAAIVDVQGGAPADRTRWPGIYYLDVLVHRASVGERWLVPLEHDAQRVPASALIPQGGTQQNQEQLDRLDVEGSKRLAAYVALKALGRHVSVTRTGARVDEVDPSSPAHAAGLVPGMIITSVDGTRVRSATALKAVLRPHRPGDTVRVGVLDGAKRRTLGIRLMGEPSAPGRGFIGVLPEDAAPIVHLPLEVTIDTGNLGGPSAGLAFTLEIYDSLTGRKLSHGRFVAATGTIDEQGVVGLVGGIKGKTVGARDHGFDVMLVPQGEAKTARRYAGSHLKVIGVKTFAGALAALGATPQK